MEESRAHSMIPPPPLQSLCSPTTANPCSRTAIGRRCSIGGCLELGNGFHLSRSGLCNFSSVNLNLSINSPSHSAAPSHSRTPPPELGAMPRLRHRMRCRRGSTRGHPQRAPSTSSSDTSSQSSEYLAGRYPDTRSGRGRSYSASHRMASPATATHASLASNLPQTAHFYFNCTLTRPRIIATISVSFREEPQIDVAGSHSGGTDAEIARDAALQTQKEDKRKGKAPIDEEAGSSHRMGRNRHGSASHENKPEADDDMAAYRCLILEEPPPPPDG